MSKITQENEYCVKIEKCGCYIELPGERNFDIALMYFLCFSFADCSQMEDQLSALGERWSHVCQWAEQRARGLKQLVNHWEQLDGELKRLKSWLAAHEQSLRLIEANPSTDRNQMLDVARQLQVNYQYSISFRFSGLLLWLVSFPPLLMRSLLIHCCRYWSCWNVIWNHISSACTSNRNRYSCYRRSLEPSRWKSRAQKLFQRLLTSALIGFWPTWSTWKIESRPWTKSWMLRDKE